MPVLILKHHIVSKGEGARDVWEQKPEGASSNPPQPGEAVAKQSCTPVTNKPPGPNPHHSLVGSGKHPALPTVKKTSCEPKRCLLFLKKSFLTLRSS